MPQGRLHIGLIDADLLAGGTRHPNLALLKIAGFLLKYAGAGQIQQNHCQSKASDRGHYALYI